MTSLFSYIVQKRLSHENENVATEALAFPLLWALEHGSAPIFGGGGNAVPVRFGLCFQQASGVAPWKCAQSCSHGPSDTASSSPRKKETSVLGLTRFQVRSKTM